MGQICHKLHHLLGDLPLFGFPFDTDKIPRNGIYILFEKGEYAHGTNRIVRIGTHTGENQLRSRLLQHFVRENKDRSIFRKNIGRALLNKARDSYSPIWELDLTTHEAKKKYSALIDAQKQKKTERQATTYMQGSFRFVVFQVDGKDQRLALESKIISTVSSCHECKPSSEWLGNFSPKDKIRASGLWQVNELYRQPLTEEDYVNLERELGR